jgi:hypothetical protein
MVAWTRAFSRVTAWARSESFHRSGDAACSLSSAVRFSRAGRSKMPPELGDPLVERADLLAQLGEHRGDVGDLALLHGDAR